jgi:hypothetical protein
VLVLRHYGEHSVKQSAEHAYRYCFNLVLFFGVLFQQDKPRVFTIAQENTTPVAAYEENGTLELKNVKKVL